jgi:hypothetical protein
VHVGELIVDYVGGCFQPKDPFTRGLLIRSGADPDYVTAAPFGGSSIYGGANGDTSTLG